MIAHGRDWNELKLVEDPAVEHLQKLGYKRIEPTVLDAPDERATLKQPILVSRLLEALKQLNPWLTDANAERAAKAITHVDAAGLAEANEALHKTLTYGTTVEQDRGDGRLSYTVRFFDFEQPDNNTFLVTQQFRVSGAKKEIRPDIVLFVNGIPLVVIECKSPTIGEKWRAEAIRQLRRYQEADDSYRGEGAPKLFETVQLVVATCGEQACYGTIGTPSRYFFEWKDPWPATQPELEATLGRKPSAQDILISGLLRPANLLVVVQNFIVFDAENGKTVKKVCRYKQFVAVNRALQRIHAAKRPDERGGVVWHTQGSGKSLTMLWLALKLRRDPRLDNPGLLLVTDRTDLDAQLSSTFEQCGFPVQRAPSVKGLRELLSNLTGLTVTTTIQKFQDATTTSKGDKDKRVTREVHPTFDESENLFVMVDEAHRTHYAGLAANLRKALPNACFLGFTGTPIDKKDRSTLQTFGPYIDKYTIEQAVEDGATVPIFYESRLPEVSIVGANLDKLFDAYFKDRSDEERAAIKKRYATEAAVASAPRRIELICLDIIEHFTTAIAPNGFKAQIVAQDRDTAVTYKETLDRLHGPNSVLIMSVAHNDEKRLVGATPPKDKQKTFIEAFKETNKPKILIVCDMLLTGFDAPVEQVMYLDKPLKEHTLLQAIARTNRRAENKTYGLIVDYWGVSKDLQDALKIFTSSDVKGALKPKLSELPLLETRHAAALRFFAQLKDKDDLNACVDVLEPEDVRQSFDQAFKRFAKSMDMLLPQPEALPYQDDLKWLGKIRGAAKARFHDRQLDLTGCGEKVRALIESAVSAERIEILVKEVSLFSKEFEEKLEALKTDEAKASEMEHAIKNEIHVHIDENPHFYESLRERLEKILEDRKAERISSAEQLKLFQELRKEAKAPHEAAAALGLDEDAFAIYGLVRERVQTGTDGAALATVLRETVGPYTEMVDWQNKDDLQRQMRRDVRKQLRSAGIDSDEAVELAEDIVGLAKARAGQG